MRIRLIELRQNVQYHIRQVKRDVRDKKRDERERVCSTYETSDEHEQEHERHARYDIGVHHGNVRYYVKRVLPPLFAEVVDIYGGGSSDNRSDS